MSRMLTSSRAGHSTMSETRNRTGRKPGTKVFNDTVVQLFTAMKAVHLTDKDTASLGVPTAPFEAIDMDEAMREDAPGWRKSIIEEYTGLLKMKAFTIKTDKLPTRRKLIPSRLVLRKRFNTKEEVTRLKS
jgi:hypothetical protein